MAVNFDAERGTVFFRTTGYDREGRRGVLALAAEIRAGMDERFPGVTTVEFTDSKLWIPPSSAATMFVIRVSSGGTLSADSAELAKRTLSSIVEDVVGAHGLRTDSGSLVYYAGRRVGVSAEERDLVLIPTVESNSTLRVRVVRHSADFDVLHRAVTEDLATRLDAAFGSNVTRETFDGD